jgi:signal transduction histidine kinase
VSRRRRYVAQRAELARRWTTADLDESLDVRTYDASTWKRPRPDGRGIRRDVALGLALSVLSPLSLALLAAAQPGMDVGWRGIEAYLWTVAGTLPLCARRVYPVAVMLICSLIFFGLGMRVPAASVSYGIQASLFLSIFAAWAWSRQRRRLHWWTAVTFTGMFLWVAWLMVDVQRDPAYAQGPGFVSPGVAIGLLTLALNVLYFFGAMAWGLAAWRGARQREELAAANAELKRQSEQIAERAVQDERLRIARDLHDVVAHHVSGIGVQAAGARLVAGRAPEASQRALRTIELTSRRAVREMQELVGLLRTRADEDRDDVAGRPRAPQPGLAQLPHLLAEAHRQGLDVRFARHGPELEVPDTVGLTLYRSVQEALTNVRKHSAASAATVTLRRMRTQQRAAVEVEVLDDGPARSFTTEPAGRGWGLAGVRERVLWHRGECEIGPRPGSGFRVRVRIPLEPVA